MTVFVCFKKGATKKDREEAAKEVEAWIKEIKKKHQEMQAKKGKS